MRKKHLFALVFTMIVSLGLIACGTGQMPTDNTTPTSENTQNQESVLQDDGGNQESQISETEDSTSPEADQESQTPDTVTITSLNGNGERFELEVPYNPERIAILDMASMDILDNLGVGDRIVGSAGTSLDYLQQYVTNDNVANLGTIKEADMEAVMACEPDIIFIGGRLSKSYDDLSEIAPVVYLATDSEKGVVESVGANARTIASIFGLEDQVDDKMAGFGDRIAALRSFAEGKNAIVGLVTSGGLNVLGNDGRCSVIGREIGFENIGVDANIDTSTHGNDVNNFMRCHRFDLVLCRKPTRFPVTGPIVYTIIHLPVYGSFLDSFLHSAASNYLTSLDAAFCILAGNCAQAIHNSQAGRPVYPGQPAFSAPL